jgi:hypothetical protein
VVGLVVVLGLEDAPVKGRKTFFEVAVTEIPEILSVGKLVDSPCRWELFWSGGRAPTTETSRQLRPCNSFSMDNVMVPFSTKTILRLRAWLAVLALVAWTGAVRAAIIQNDAFWKDTDGGLICSQGGGILKVGDAYYWYGVKYGGAATYAASPTGKNGDTSFKSVTCYSSTDLAHWKFEGNVLASDQTGGGWFGRIGVVYNATTGKYVLVGQGSSPGGVAGEYFATSSSPTGPFTFANVQETLSFITNGGTGDQTTFQDDDGSAYVICSSVSGRSHLYVAPLRASDFLAIESATEIFRGAGREGNCMFKYNGRYYFCSSDLHGWNASHAYVISASNILGPYGAEEVMQNTDLDFTHVSQTGFFVTVHGSSQDTVIYAGDRWSDFAGNGLGFNQWCPLSFDGDRPVFHSLSQWDFNAQTGEWSVGPGNNYVLNPSFEADRVAQNVLAGWSNVTNLAGADPNGNAKGHAHAGNFCMQQSYSTSYTATMPQAIDGLPNDRYALSAWVKSSGGQRSAAIGVSNFGGTGLSHSIAEATPNWTLVTIPGFEVSNGTCTVVINSDAGPNEWIQVDDISLIRAPVLGVPHSLEDYR